MTNKKENKETKVNEKNENATDDKEGVEVEIPIEMTESEMIAHLKEKLETEKARAEDYLKRLKYLQADFENLQKRTKKEMERIQKVGIIRLLGKILTIVDDLERAVTTAQDGNKEQTNSAFFDGMKMILDQFHKILKEEGVKQIDALGKRVDPLYHEVVCRIESSEHPNNTIIEEYRKGYLLDNEVIRPATVLVSKTPQKDEAIKDDSINNKENDKMEG